MESKQAVFDGLATVYDQFRPRYPQSLIDAIRAFAPEKHRPYIVDIGAGTGIALEKLLVSFGTTARFAGIDISSDMVELGRKKYPDVTWAVGEAEAFLEEAECVDVIVAAQSFQWMDRGRALSAGYKCLNPGGLFAIIQNNRDFNSSPFLSAYESLLEEMSPGYKRDYRSYDFLAEVRQVFRRDGELNVMVSTRWSDSMSPDSFVGMVCSSSQAQRAISTRGGVFLEAVRGLISQYFPESRVTVPYLSELVVGRKDMSRMQKS